MKHKKMELMGKYSLVKIFYTATENEIDEMFSKYRKRAFDTFGDKLITHDRFWWLRSF